MAIGTGNASTIAFGTSSFSANVTSIGGTEQTRDAIEDSHLGTTSQKTYIAGDLYEPGEFELEFQWDPAFTTFPPIAAVAETITITFQSTGGGTLAGSGFLTAASGPTVANNELMIGTATVKWDGQTEVAYST